MIQALVIASLRAMVEAPAFTIADLINAGMPLLHRLAEPRRKRERLGIPPVSR